ncbi:MAG: AI-2E family transporter [Patescibacteria group bacterium]
MDNKVSFDVSWQTLWRIFVFALGIVVLYFAREAVSVFLAAIVIALGLDPIVSFLEERRVSRLLGTLAIFLTGLLILSAVVYFVVPVLIVEAGSFLEEFNKIISVIFGVGLPKTVIQNLGANLDKALNYLNAANISVTGAISTIVSKAVLVLATLLISFYLSAEKDGPERLLRLILPNTYEKSILTVFNRFKIKIRRWFGAQLALSLLMGALVSVGLWLLGVRYFLVLGLLAAVFEIVPIIGPVLSGAVIFLVAIGDSLSLGLYSLLFAFLLQQFENHILIPVVMGRAMRVHPVIVIVSLLAGTEVAGFVGILLSVPIAVIAQETLSYLVEKKSQKRPLDI